MIDNLLIEIRKDNFFKKRKYSIVIDGINQGILTPVNSRKFISLEVGKHQVSIQCEDYLMEKEIIVKRNDKFKRFYIKPTLPTLSLKILKGISIGIWLTTVCFILYSFFVWNTKISIPIIVVLLFSILFSKTNKTYNKNFIIQE